MEAFEVVRKRLKAAGVVLIALGALALVVGRISYTTHRELITVGPYSTPLETSRVITLRPFGALTILAGVIFIVASKRA